ncbi:LCP family protein [Nakamurella leprariae]|uniref:LCP family protein n=1 Tax=Nakamurella leprariae TaxID=2803911 RepID=A0A939BZ21_9ACTN|nr:LCP family protein [Nakamurella leprariae]MBM9467695.1 LCP family protein [Nakamurella leprariae]
MASLLLAVAVFAGTGIAWAVTDSIQRGSATSDAAANAGGAGVTFEGGMTMLLVGSDSRTDADGNPLSAEELAQVGTEDDGGGTNTDTMIVVHVPEGGGRATAVSLPRDTWIGKTVTEQVDGPYANGSSGTYQPNKINSFYGTAKAYTEQRLVAEGVTDRPEIERQSNEAGRTMLVKVVQAFTGLQVDHYAEVNLLGFYLLSNAIGGIPVCLNAPVDDPWSGADFAAGPQEVQGTAALAFVRQRHGLPGGDLDRVRRQQAFLSGAADKILSIGSLNPARINALIEAANRSVVFDKDFAVLDFATQMLDMSSGNITFATLPTHGTEPSASSDALATDSAEIQAFFASIAESSTAEETAAEPVDPASVTVDIQDGTIADGVTDFAVDKVRTAGFELGITGVVPGTDVDDETAATSMRYAPGERDAAVAVQQAFGLGVLSEDPDVPAGHVVVEVGTDLNISISGASSTPAPEPAADPAQTAAAPGAGSAAPVTPSFQSSVPCVN